MTIFILFLILGCFIGVLAGLLGVGGGAVIVPVIMFVLKSQNVSDDVIMKIAIGTSFATIILTSLSSVFAHHRKGSVLWGIAGYLSVGVIIGSTLGGLIVALLSNTILQLFFCIFIGYTAYKMLMPASSKMSNTPVKVIKNRWMALFGTVIGFISSFVGIGGGSITVPFLVALGHNMRKAIATSAAVGLPIAVVGALGALYHGFGLEDLPKYSLGYIYLPAFIGISATSVFCAPLGAKLAYYLPVKHLKRIFGMFLLIIFIKISSELISKLL